MIEADVEVNVYNDLRVGSNIQLVQDHFCKGGVPAVQITSSREYVRYELLNNGIIVSSSTGNGNTITLQAPAIEDTTTYQVRAKVVNGACERLFDDELVVKVEES